MTLVKNKSDYSDRKEVSKPTKSGIRIISEMPTKEILMYTANRHKFGLLTFTSLSMAVYIAYDKVVRLFI